MIPCPRQEEALDASEPIHAELYEHIQQCSSCRALTEMKLALEKWKQDDVVRAGVPVYTWPLIQGEWRREERRRRIRSRVHRWTAAGSAILVPAILAAVDRGAFISISHIWDMAVSAGPILLPLVLAVLVSWPTVWAGGQTSE